MRQLTGYVRAGIGGLDQSFAIPNAKLSRQDKLLYLIVFTSRLCVNFLTIHPYVNGNGHIARSMMWAVMGRYGFWPERCPIEPRTQDPAYIQTIRAYRTGHPEQLEDYLLNCILGQEPPQV